MIEDTFADVSSRHFFNSWYQSHCVVLYDRCIEFDWECPVANTLLAKFRGKGWNGQVFILKGHYREFADSFDRWITGKGKNTASESETEDEDQKQRRDREYEEWLRGFDESGEGLGGRRITELGPAKREERARAVDQRQGELEKELEARVPALWRKAMASRGEDKRRSVGAGGGISGINPRGADYGPSTMTNPDDMDDESVFTPQSPPPPPFSATADPDTARATNSQFQGGYDKAQLVEPLVSGLQKMREASGLGPPLDSTSQDPALTADYHSSGYPHQQYDGDTGLGSTSYPSGKAEFHDQEGLTDDYNDNYYDGVEPISESWQGIGGGGGMGMASGTVSPMPQEWQQDESGMSSYGRTAETATEGERGGAKKVKRRTQLLSWDRFKGSGR